MHDPIMSNPIPGAIAARATAAPLSETHLDATSVLVARSPREVRIEFYGSGRNASISVTAALAEGLAERLRQSDQLQLTQAGLGQESMDKAGGAGG